MTGDSDPINVALMVNKKILDIPYNTFWSYDVINNTVTVIMKAGLFTFHITNNPSIENS